MIYLLYGSDTTKSRAKLHDMVKALITKKPDASHERINDETFDASHLEELIGENSYSMFYGEGRTRQAH